MVGLENGDEEILDTFELNQLEKAGRVGQQGLGLCRFEDDEGFEDLLKVATRCFILWHIKEGEDALEWKLIIGESDGKKEAQKAIVG